MSNQNQPFSTPLPSQQETQTTPSNARFARVRGWLRSRTGRVLIPLIALLLGIVIGIAAIFLFGTSGMEPIIVIPASTKGDIIVEADRSFINQLVTKNLNSSGIPGQIQNVNVNLARGSQMMVSGKDIFSILGVNVTRPFSFIVHPYVSSCVLKIHITHADFSNIPVTSFAQSFESQINQELQMKPEGLPSGFQYCTTGVRTEPTGMFVTYSAKPD